MPVAYSTIPLPAEVRPEAAESSEDEEPQPSGAVQAAAENEQARWTESELAVLDRYLPRYKTKTKAERKTFLSVKVLAKLKSLYTGNDWTSRKQVSEMFTIDNPPQLISTQQVKYWFNNRCRRDVPPRPKFQAPRKITLNQVLARDYKAEIKAIATDLAAGARSGSQGHFSNWTRATAVFKAGMSATQLEAAEAEQVKWESEGLPIDMRRQNAVKYGRKSLEQAAERQYKEFDMRVLTWEYHHNTDGKAIFSL